MVLRLEVGLIASLLAIAAAGRSQEAAAAQFDLLQAPAAAAQEAVRREAAGHPEAEATIALARTLSSPDSADSHETRRRLTVLADFLRRPEIAGTLKHVFIDPGPDGRGPRVVGLFTHGQNLILHEYFLGSTGGSASSSQWSVRVSHLTRERRNPDRGDPHTREPERRDKVVNGSDLATLWCTGDTEFHQRNSPNDAMSAALTRLFREVESGVSIDRPAPGAVALPRLHSQHSHNVNRTTAGRRGSGLNVVPRRRKS